MSPPHLSLRNVVKTYDGKANAVDGVTIDIARGEFITFLGPSGSGKTTTLLMIAGFEYPTSGVIELDGHDLLLSKPYERNIGMVFQSYALFPHMTAAKNVMFPLRMRHVPRHEREARSASILELVGLRGLGHRYPRELSGGQQQRVALARGLVFDPELLLLDEPLGALDKNLREQMQVEIKRIHRKTGTTMIYVTHDQTEAMTMSDRIAVFAHGKLEQVGSPLEVYNRPVSRFVGEFIGDSNFFAARINSTRPGWLELIGIGPVRVATDRPISSGDPVLMIRPERLRLCKAGETDDLNIVDIAIDEIINYGDSVVAIGNSRGVPLRMRLPGSELAALRLGTTVKVGWNPDDAHLLVSR